VFPFTSIEQASDDSAENAVEHTGKFLLKKDTREPS
jgi:hypothetical protein